jgi:hypothetical protein
MMDEKKLKIYLLWASILGIAAFSLSALGFVSSYAESAQPGTYRSFAVNGEGRVTAIPDLAEFNFSVLTEGGNDIAALQKTNTEKTNKALAFLKKEGVAGKDIKTLGYSLTPRYQTFFCDGRTVCPPAQIIGYSVESSVLVKIRDFEKISGILGGVINEGANTVSQLQFTIEDRTGLENKARAAAIKEAMEKAKTVTHEANARLGKLISINEGFYNPGPVFYKSDASAGFGGAMSAPEAPRIEPGSQEIVSTVTLTYELR